MFTTFSIFKFLYFYCFTIHFYIAFYIRIFLKSSYVHTFNSMNIIIITNSDGRTFFAFPIIIHFNR